MVDRLVLVCAWRTTATPRSYSPGGVSQMNKLVMGLGHLQGEIGGLLLLGVQLLMMMMMAILDRAICLEEVAISVTRNVNGDC